MKKTLLSAFKSNWNDPLLRPFAISLAICFVVQVLLYYYSQISNICIAMIFVSWPLVWLIPTIIILRKIDGEKRVISDLCHNRWLATSFKQNLEHHRWMEERAKGYRPSDEVCNRLVALGEYLSDQITLSLGLQPTCRCDNPTEMALYTDFFQEEYRKFVGDWDNPQATLADLKVQEATLSSYPDF